jgi:hypothetical protein
MADTINDNEDEKPEEVQSAADDATQVESQAGQGDAAAKGDDQPADEGDKPKKADDKALAREKRAAEKAAREKEKKAKGKSKAKGRRGIPTFVWVIIAVVCLAGGIAIGKFFLGGVTSASGKTTVSEGQLDTVVATYTYNGKTTNLTAREVIQMNSTLDNAKDSDGNYTLPTADAILSAARSQIIQQEAEAQGITVSDDDVKSYAKEQLGTDDFDTIASNYGMDSDTVKTILKQSAEMSKLKNKVVGATSTQPTAPTAPSDGNDQTASADYAKYIIDLAGDEWDSDKGTWASTDGDYYKALSKYTITNDSATYEAAEAAYYVAYQKYSTEASEASTQWTNYIDGILCNASISISSLAA